MPILLTALWITTLGAPTGGQAPSVPKPSLTVVTQSEHSDPLPGDDARFFWVIDAETGPLEDRVVSIAVFAADPYETQVDDPRERGFANLQYVVAIELDARGAEELRKLSDAPDGVLALTLADVTLEDGVEILELAEAYAKLRQTCTEEEVVQLLRLVPRVEYPFENVP